jgi:hypothetical protein
VFDSIKEAAKQLNLTIDAVKYRLKTKDEWHRINP